MAQAIVNNRVVNKEIVSNVKITTPKPSVCTRCNPRNYPSFSALVIELDLNDIEKQMSNLWHGEPHFPKPGELEVKIILTIDKENMDKSCVFLYGYPIEFRVV